eukprot:GEMP01031238.1.p1 GENE.GEMP01031238.1~~GEMP01031238.1.p1  ORF type:complete len:446 (+),score=93.73 GEMP01031238.1:22-1338(+)
MMEDGDGVCWDSGYKDLRGVGPADKPTPGTNTATASRGSTTGWKNALGGVNSFLTSVAKKTQDAVPATVTQRISSLSAMTIDKAKSITQVDTTRSLSHMQVIGQLLRHLTWEVTLRIGAEVTDNLEHADAITKVVTGTSLRQIANTMLEIWLNTKSEAFGGCVSWSSVCQSDWLSKVYKISLGPKQTPSTFSLFEALITFCSCLSEFAFALNGDVIAWPIVEKSSWEFRVKEARRLVEDFRDSLQGMPSKLSLPAMRVMRHGSGNSAQFCLAPTTMVQKMVDAGVSIPEVLDELGMGCSIMPATLPDCVVPDAIPPAGESIPNEEERAAFTKLVAQSAKALLEKKLYPVILCNRSNQQLRVCMYAGTDKILAIPVGGFGGLGTLTLDPNKRAFMRLDGEEFWVKAFRPGFIDRPLYSSATVVKRGQTLSLRSNDCQIE